MRTTRDSGGFSSSDFFSNQGLNPKQSTELFHQLAITDICQEIDNEIARLEKYRTNLSLRYYSSETQIQILNRLRQLIVAPDSFSKKEYDKFFGKDLTLIDNFNTDEDKSLSQLLDTLFSEKKYLITHNNKKKLCDNEHVIDTPLDVWDEFYDRDSDIQTFNPKTRPLTENKEFYNKLRQAYGHIVIPKRKINKYYFDLAENLVPPKNKKLKHGRLYISKKTGKYFHYSVITPEGELIEDDIDRSDLEVILGSRFTAFDQALQSALNKKEINRLNPFIQDVLQITSFRHHTYDIKPKRQFTRIIYLGDSLSDKGEMYDSILGYFSKLIGKTPSKSFSNTLVWDDDVDNLMEIEILKRIIGEFILGITDYRSFNQCTLEQQKEITRHVTNIKLHLRSKYNASFTLDENRVFCIKNDKGENVVFSRTRAIGGLTVHDYAFKVDGDVAHFFPRLVLSTLKKQCEKLLDDEKDVPDEVRKKTIVHILAGANDLVTVNARPTYEEVDKAVDGIIECMELLWGNGYREFDLTNLPDLSKTPRFQYQSRLEQLNAQLCSEYYCRQLSTKLTLFRNSHLDSGVEIFGLFAFLKNGLKHPEKYQLNTKYQAKEVSPGSDEWKVYQKHAQGCRFIRAYSRKQLAKIKEKIKSTPNSAAYVRFGNRFLYINSNKENYIQIFNDHDKAETIYNKLHRVDDVPMIPEFKLRYITNLTGHCHYEDSGISKESESRFVAKNNIIYYHMNENQTALHYQVKDVFDRARKGNITAQELEQQINGCELVKVTNSPIQFDDHGQFVKVTYEMPANEVYVRFENDIYHFSKDLFSDRIRYKKYSLPLEELDQFDEQYKPWYAPRTLSPEENKEIKIQLKQRLFAGIKTKIPSFTNEDIQHYLPAVQAILAKRDHVVADGDLYTPAQSTQAFTRYLKESGPIKPGDLMPTTNKVFNDLLHPLGDLGIRWAQEFFNNFILYLYNFMPDVSSFTNLLPESYQKKFPTKKGKQPHTDDEVPGDEWEKERAKNKEKEAKHSSAISPNINAVQLMTAFYSRYKKIKSESERSIFAFFRGKEEDFIEKHISRDINGAICDIRLSLNDIFIEAGKKNKKVLETLVQLGWTNSKGQLTAWAKEIPVLQVFETGPVNVRINQSGSDRSPLLSHP